MSGRRKSRFGTGRVMSQMRMQAERAPAAASAELAAVEGGGHRGRGILGDRHGRLLDHRRLAACGQPHLQSAAPVEKPDLHLTPPTRATAGW